MANEEKSTHILDDMKICRLCLAETEDLVNYTDNQELQLLVTTYFAVKTEIPGKRPKFVCEMCVEFIGRFSEFKQMCMMADSMLATYSETGIWQTTVESPAWLKPVRKRRLQHEDLVAAKNSRYEIIQVVEPLPVQSPTISSESAFHFSGECENKKAVILHQPTQSFQPTIQAYPEQKLFPSQVTDLQTTPIYMQRLKHTSPLQMEYQPNSFVRLVPFHHPQNQQQLLLQPPPSHHASFRQTETLQPISPAASTHSTQPSSEQPIVVPPESIRPTQSTLPPISIHEFYCTMCSLGFSTKDEIRQHRKSNHPAMDLTLCWCGKLLITFPVFVWHLKQHKDTDMCVLCLRTFPTLEHLYSHVDRHLEVGLVHRCKHCSCMFLDQDRWALHMDEKHKEFVQSVKSG